MRVKYRIFDQLGYEYACEPIEGMCPDTPLIEKFVATGTGEVIQYIQGGFFSQDMLLIADDITGDLLKVKMSDCKKIVE